MGQSALISDLRCEAAACPVSPLSPLSPAPSSQTRCQNNPSKSPITADVSSVRGFLSPDKSRSSQNGCQTASRPPGSCTGCSLGPGRISPWFPRGSLSPPAESLSKCHIIQDTIPDAPIKKHFASSSPFPYPTNLHARPTLHDFTGVLRAHCLGLRLPGRDAVVCLGSPQSPWGLEITRRP